QPGVLSYLLSMTVGKRYGGTVTADELGLPVQESGLCLPCGACGRWQA
ncbi:MAG: SAM-dependent methyltransferase, partial [Lachnospiraceae bacterium]|nr:SAM-dependent methyltransferase [Lachnospiraceae bacterium]